VIVLVTISWVVLSVAQEPADRAFATPPSTRVDITRNEPAFGLLQILIPGEDRLGKYCSEPSEQTWLKEYYCNIKATDRYLVIFTLWLALATIVLAISTIGLWIVSVCAGRRQSRETKILQRAYLSANIGGISPFLTDEEREGHLVVAHVDITNVGHLPARRVSCCVKIALSTNGDLTDFPIADQDLSGSYVLTPGAVTRQGSDSITATGKGYVYVWGRMKYLDGFGTQRTTNFCHRYPLAMFRRLDGDHFGIPAEFGRFHAVGNSTDEDQM
jgi:hypothetical protein